MFLNPSVIVRIAKYHQILFQEDYDIIKSSIDEEFFEDLEKATRQFNKLIPVKTLVTRNGKVFTETVYINPDKKKKEDLEKKYRKGSSTEIKEENQLKEAKLQIDVDILKRGDLVKVKMQDGSEVVGQFRDFIKEGKKVKLNIRVTYKNKQGESVTRNIERWPDDIKLVENNGASSEIKTKRLKTNDFKIGDTVSVTIRLKKPNEKGVRMEEREGVLTRKNQNGFVVLLDNGDYVTRNLSTIRKVEDTSNQLSEQEKVVLYKAIKTIKNSIQDKVNMISIFEKKKGKDWQSDVEKIKKAIEEDKNIQANYFEVFKGNLPFDSIVKESIKKQKLDVEE